MLSRSMASYSRSSMKYVFNRYELFADIAHVIDLFYCLKIGFAQFPLSAN